MPAFINHFYINVISGNDMNPHTWYAGLYGLSRNTVVPSLATFYLLGYVSSTLSVSTIPEYCFAFFGYIDTLPLGLLCLLGYFASWATFPLGLISLLGYFASWAALPLGLLCLLGYFASWAIYWHFASWDMSHWHCLLWQCRYTAMPLGLFQYAATWAMSHRHCLLWQCQNTAMPLGLCHHWALVSMSNVRLCQYPKSGYSVRPDTIRDVILVIFEMDISICYWARIGND
jgi:hypothetical protein